MTTALMLGLTLSLGVWQLERLAWKTALLASIDRAESAPPVPVTAEPPAFQRVVATGRYLPGTARYGVEVRSVATGATLGSQVIAPLQLKDGSTIIVDRGWAPAKTDVPTPDGLVTVEGYARAPEQPIRFGAADNPGTHQFYALDPAAIGRSLGLTTVAPFTLVQLGATSGIPEPATALPRPPNDHLSYAVTWFALSVALIVVFLVYAYGAVRTTRRLA